MESIKFIDIINILDGKVTYDGFDIDINTPLADQVDSLREDMLQIEYGKRFILDVGWEPDFDPNGYFIVRVILDTDWLDPILETKCYTLAELKTVLESAALLIHEQLKIKDLPYRDVQYEKSD